MTDKSKILQIYYMRAIKIHLESIVNSEGINSVLLVKHHKDTGVSVQEWLKWSAYRIYNFTIDYYFTISLVAYCERAS